jgi:N-acetylmuramoyl-L-alanine amidase
MEQRDNLLIAIDAGHGGWDNGAMYGNRKEKDDNLALARLVSDEFEGQCVSVLMTRDSDTFVELRDRADMANAAKADLFISLHRNSYTEHTPTSNGTENWIYLTAPEATSGTAAQLVLDEVVRAGVQSNRGVRRGNYYVLRKTAMPAMLLESGYIIDEADNRLYDQRLGAYAKAIAKGALRFFNVPYREEMPCRPFFPGGSEYERVALAQRLLNGAGYLPGPIDGIYSLKTRSAIMMFQRDHFLEPTGIPDDETLAAMLG